MNNTIYSKLSKLREEVSGISKSGKGKVGKGGSISTQYFTLADIIKVTKPAMDELNLTTVVAIDREVAKMHLIDTETKDFITFSVPYYKSTQPNDDAQGNGAGITYTRRYLYVTMLDLLSDDELENGEYINTNKPQNAVRHQNTAPQTYQQAPQQYNEPPVIYNDTQPAYDDTQTSPCESCGGPTVYREGNKDGKQWSAEFCANKCGAAPRWL